MRVLHLIPNMVSGGAQQQLCYLAAAQQAAGFDVHVAVFRPGPKLARLRETKAEIHRLRGAGNHDPRLLGEVVFLLRRIRPDVVQTWLNQMDVLGGLATRWARRPWILSERASSGLYPTNTKTRLRAALARRADAIVSNSEEGDRYWASRVGPRVLRRVIRNGVPAEEIRRALPRSDASLDLPAGQKMVLYAGRFSPEKNLETLIPALGELTRRRAATAYLCGEGTHEDEVRSLIERLGFQRRVRFVGYVDDVWSWMKRADVFVSVSHGEGQPNTVLEAATCGCPLVLSDIPGHREMLKDSEALFVDPGSAVAIADALEAVLAEPEAAKGRAEAARDAVASLSVDAMARRYEGLYQEVLERRVARGAA